MKNYCDYAKNKWPENFDRVEKTQQKSDRRYTLERSIRGMLTYLHAVASTHFYFGPVNPTITPKIEIATEGAQQLFELIQKQMKVLKSAPFPHGLSQAQMIPPCLYLRGYQQTKRRVF